MHDGAGGSSDGRPAFYRSVPQCGHDAGILSGGVVRAVAGTLPVSLHHFLVCDLKNFTMTSGACCG